jgi:putative membrane protein
MKRPVARPVTPEKIVPETIRAPRAFTPDAVTVAEPQFDEAEAADDLVSPEPRRMGLVGRILWTTGGILVSLALGLAAERLIRDLFERYEWLGWAGLAALAAFLVALLALVLREIWALRRLRTLDKLKAEAADALTTDRPDKARAVLTGLEAVYAGRADLARARRSLEDHTAHMLDGAEQIHLAERTLMAPLDTRARALTAASARRVALVTAVSPRALIDIAFVIYESVRLAGAIARLYGARPGFFGFWRLTGAVLAHLAVTGGLVLTDGVVEQLVGQGLAAKLSARLGEGVVNGLMTVRVGIAAMRVVRPLPFAVQKQPVVRDFIGDLANVTQTGEKAG